MGFGPVLVLGASTCGLAIARGLRKANIGFNIFDSGDVCAPEFDNSIVKIRTSLATLRDLLLEDIKDEVETDTTLVGSRDRSQRISSETKVLDGNSGKVIGDIEGCGQSLRIRKSRLRALLRQGIDVKVSERCCNRRTRF